MEQSMGDDFSEGRAKDEDVTIAENDSETGVTSVSGTAPNLLTNANGLRLGFTTGSCAAAGAKSAVYMLLTGRVKDHISITTPKGIVFNAQIVDIVRSESSVSCAVIKDGGDDPDVTTGAHIVSTVSFLPARNAGANDCANSATIAIPADSARNACVPANSASPANSAQNDVAPYVVIEGGEGVGRVTLPGLDQKPGEAAINHVPREMITKEVLEVCHLCDYNGGISVKISVPEGETLAEKTFNPRLGIKGGISILGTSGIVEPMSSQALLDTIRTELNQKKALGATIATVSPGNYGLEFMKEKYGYDLDKSVKCSNFIGETIDMAAELGFKKFLLTGHIGKLIKVSGGIMNTHSKEADCRMELLAAAAVKAGCNLETISGILNAAVTEEGIDLIERDGRREQAMAYVMERIMFFLEKRAGGKMQMGCIMYSNDFGLLAQSRNAADMLAELVDLHLSCD